MASPLAMLAQCPNEKRYPLRCPYADGSKIRQCEKCFVLTNPEDDSAVKIIEEYMKSVGHLPESSQEMLRFHMRDVTG